MKSKVMRIDGIVAKRIEEIQKHYGVTSTQASKILFTGTKPKRGRPKRPSVRELFNRNLDDYDIRLIYNPKNNGK